MSLETRLKLLEEGARPDGGVVFFFMNFDETEEAAKARWLAEHPGRSLNEDSLTVYLMRWSREGDEDVFAGMPDQREKAQ